MVSDRSLGWPRGCSSGSIHLICFFFFSSRRRHTRYWRDWSSDVCSSDLRALSPVALLDLDAAHRERLPHCSHRAEPAAPDFGRAQQLQVDLDLVHLLHAPDVGVPELLVGVDERTRPLETGGGIDDLVAVDVAAPALELILRTERKRGRALRLRCHDGIVLLETRRRKT